MASKTQKPNEATEPATAPLAAGPDDRAGYFKVRLVKRPTGPRRRIVRLGSGAVRFNAGQEDPKMVDFPEKKLYLSNRELAHLQADADYTVTKAEPEKPKVNSLGFGIGSRTIDEGKTVKIGSETGKPPEIAKET